MPNDSSGHDKARQLMDQAWSSRRSGDYTQARWAIKKAISLLRRFDASTDLATALGRLGHIEMDQEHWAAARAAYQEAISVCERAGDRSGLAHKTRHLGDAYRQAGRLEDARQCYQQALGLYRGLSDPPWLDYANALGAAAIAEEDAGGNDEAFQLWSEARDLYEKLRLDDGVVESTKHLNDLRTAAEVPLSRATESRLIALFTEPETQTAADLLVEMCGRNLPLMADKKADAIERIRIAALKVSGGDLEVLGRAIELANIDWRDLLVEAGFAHDVRAHLSWQPD